MSGPKRAGEVGRLCVIDGCPKKHFARGWCYMHYRRWWLENMGAGADCRIDNCGKRAMSRGLCEMHYRRWRKHGDPLVCKKILKAGLCCSIEGCDKPVHRAGLCQMHATRRQRHGDPHVKLVGQGSLATSGYWVMHVSGRREYLHRIVLKRKIGPGQHPCHWCGRVVSWDLHWPDSTEALIVDHLDHMKTNNDPANLVPACGPCNSKRALTGRRRGALASR